MTYEDDPVEIIREPEIRCDACEYFSQYEVIITGKCIYWSRKLKELYDTFPDRWCDEFKRKGDSNDIL
jgi:hypothetical protein